MSSSKHIEDEIKKITWALLQKAGHNPKLTPRLLRQQLEKQMKVQSGSFDKYRKLIKSVIFVWWDQSQDDLGLNSNKQVDDKNAAFALQMLTQLAKAAGKMPGVMKNLPEEPHDRIKALREKFVELLLFLFLLYLALIFVTMYFIFVDYVEWELNAVIFLLLRKSQRPRSCVNSRMIWMELMNLKL